MGRNLCFFQAAWKKLSLAQAWLCSSAQLTQAGSLWEDRSKSQSHLRQGQQPLSCSRSEPGIPEIPGEGRPFKLIQTSLQRSVQ